MHQINSVRVIVLPGAVVDGIDVRKAIDFVKSYRAAISTERPTRYEVVIRYDDGGKINGEFHDKSTTLDFLQLYQTEDPAQALDIRDEDLE
jgi:hypothetical protein